MTIDRIEYEIQELYAKLDMDNPRQANKTLDRINYLEQQLDLI